MGREDGANVQLVQQFLHTLRRDAGLMQGADGRTDRFAAGGRKGRIVALPQDPCAMAIFGQVHQFQVAAFHADNLLQLADVQPGEPLFHRRSGLRVARTPLLGQPQETFRQAQQFAAAMRADHAGQFPAEKAHVAAKGLFIGGAGGSRTGSGDNFHNREL